MYEYIKGNVVSLSPATVVIEAGGIGYLINISLQTYSQVGTEKLVTLLLHHVQREDAQLLFGFYEADEREVFRQLISVTGVGVNTARMMLSSISSAELVAAIESEDVAKLKAAKGIGIKTAQRIIVDLKGKVRAATLAGALPTTPAGSAKQEALSALVTLGFAKAAAEKMLDVLVAEGYATSVEELIRQSLKRL